MMQILEALIFSGSLAVAGYAIVATVLPKWQRIADALAGSPSSAPLETLVRAERRIAVRRWAALSEPVSARFRAAA